MNKIARLLVRILDGYLFSYYYDEMDDRITITRILNFVCTMLLIASSFQFLNVVESFLVSPWSTAIIPWYAIAAVSFVLTLGFRWHMNSVFRQHGPGWWEYLNEEQDTP